MATPDMTIPQAGARIGYIPAIDGLRAVAVVSVIVYHLWPQALPGGFNGVDIFFVISGFVVTGSMAGRSFGSLKELLLFFYARRLMRIMPALVAMLLVAILATQLFVPNAWLSNSAGVTGGLAFAGLSNIALAFDSDTYFGPQAGYNPFTHTWSLGVEEQFYLLFPFLLYRRQTSESGVTRLVALLSAGSLLLCGVLAFVDAKLSFYLIVTRFWELGAGMLLCLTLDRWKPRLTAIGGTLLIPVALVLVAGGLVIPKVTTTPFPFALLPVIGTAALIAAVCAFPAAGVTRLLETRPMVSIGKLSYSLYLWHWPVFVLFRWTCGLDTLPLQLAALALSCGLATASYLLVEQPLRSHPRIAAAPRKRVVSFALGGVALSAMVGVAMLAAHDRLTLSVTRDHAAWYADARHPLNKELSRCTVTERVTRFAGGKITSWVPEAGCVPAETAFTVFAIGDSHNLAYAPNYRQLAAETGATVHAWFRARCPVLNLIASHASAPRCKDWYDAVFADLQRRAKPGDVVFMPALRLPRLTNQYEGDPDIVGTVSVSSESIAEAQAIVNALAGAGAGLVIEAPKPIFRSPPFRCSDWFNRANPICAGGLTMPRAELLARQQPVTRAITALVNRQRRLFLWDPFPALCPQETCDAQPHGTPLFFDGDHLSGAGNDLLYPGMRGAILAAHGATARQKGPPLP